MRFDFDWSPTKAASNAAKHGVTFDEAVSVFRDPLALSILDNDHDADEERWITLGATLSGRILLVVHTYQEDGPGRAAIRIISARRPTKNEARQYREAP